MDTLADSDHTHQLVVTATLDPRLLLVQHKLLCYFSITRVHSWNIYKCTLYAMAILFLLCFGAWYIQPVVEKKDHVQIQTNNLMIGGSCLCWEWSSELPSWPAQRTPRWTDLITLHVYRRYLFCACLAKVFMIVFLGSKVEGGCSGGY